MFYQKTISCQKRMSYQPTMPYQTTMSFQIYQTTMFYHYSRDISIHIVKFDMKSVFFSDFLLFIFLKIVYIFKRKIHIYVLHPRLGKRVNKDTCNCFLYFFQQHGCLRKFPTNIFIVFTDFNQGISGYGSYM